MPDTELTLTAILVTHLVILAVQFVATRYTILTRRKFYGICLILLPMGFQAFGVDLGTWTAPLMVFLGVMMVLNSLRRPHGEMVRESGG